MNISANHLKRYQEIGLLLWKYGRSDLVLQMGIHEAVDPQALKPAGGGEATPDKLAADLEAMGPTYVKLLDLSMVDHTTPGMQENLLKLLLAISEGNSDEAADLVIHISETTEEFNRAEFRRRLGQLMASRQDQGLQQLNVGRSLLEVKTKAVDAKLVMEGFQKVANRITTGIVLAALIMGASQLFFGL